MLNNIIVKPIITEKFVKHNEKADAFNKQHAGKPKREGRSQELHPTKQSQYAFWVSKDANKIQIRKAIEELYSVNVESVRTQNYIGKVKSRYTKSGYTAGRVKTGKRAIVTLAVGEAIDFYENIN